MNAKYEVKLSDNVYLRFWAFPVCETCSQLLVTVYMDHIEPYVHSQIFKFNVKPTNAGKLWKASITIYNTVYESEDLSFEDVCNWAFELYYNKDNIRDLYMW